MKTIFPPAVAALALFAGCTTATTVKQTDLAADSPPAPRIIYVTDFPFPTATPPDADADSKSAKLSASMAARLVEDLKKAGLPAQRLAPDAPLPAEGWLLSGKFVMVDEGSRLGRSFVGFGVGATHLQVETALDDLSDHSGRHLYAAQTAATSGKAPGGLMPAGMVRHLLMSGLDMAKTEKKAAEEIAAEIARQIKNPKPAPR